MPPGGRRQGAGRPKQKLNLPDSVVGRVLGRVGELNLPGIKNVEDYALSLLKSKDERIRKEVFIEFMHQYYGRPVARTETKHEFDQNAPFKIVIEHIGRPTHKASAEAK